MLNQNWARTYGLRYHRFLSILRQVAHRLPPRYAYPTAAWLARYLSPHREIGARRYVHHIVQHHAKQLTTPPADVWRSMLTHVGVSNLNIFRIPLLDQAWLNDKVDIECDFDLTATLANGRGLFLMTYHNHHNFLFTVSIGLWVQGYRIRTLAMEPSISPIYPYISDIYDTYFADCERFYQGGEFLYVQEKTPTQALRAIGKTLKAGDIVISLNDIFSPYAEKRTQHFPFLGHTLPCPIGTVDLAIRSGATMAAGYIRWLHSDQFALRLFELPSEHGVNAVMQAYLAGLTQMINSDAGLWEGWRLWPLQGELVY